MKTALDDAKRGGAPMSPQIARKVVEFFQQEATKSIKAAAPPDEIQSLSAREMDVLRLLAAGQGYKQIAADLTLGLDTVRTYAPHLPQVHVNSRTEADVKFLHSKDAPLGACRS